MEREGPRAEERTPSQAATLAGGRSPAPGAVRLVLRPGKHSGGEWEEDERPPSKFLKLVLQLSSRLPRCDAESFSFLESLPSS